MENPLWSYIFKPRLTQDGFIKLLHQLPVFENLNDVELLYIEKSLHKRVYKCNEIIFTEGSPGACMYIIIEGEVIIQKRVSNEESVDLATIKDGSFFGEIALVDEVSRSATAVAVKDSNVVALSKPALESISERKPRLGIKIIANIARLLSQRLVKANENVEIFIKEKSNNDNVYSKVT